MTLKPLDLTKAYAEQSDAELATTLRMHSGWVCLRGIGEGIEIRGALTEAASRLESRPLPLDEDVVETAAKAIYESAPSCEPWTGLSGAIQDRYRRYARAAITATRSGDGELRTRMFLEILSAMGGNSDAGDYSWTQAFCEEHEGRDPDTFNAAIDAGYVSFSHDSDTDCSTIRLTDKGRAALSSSGDKP